jgi:selenocysteine lyase/cysteine desulfurase
MGINFIANGLELKPGDEARATGNKAVQDGLDAAFDFYLRVGPEKIEQRIIALADSLRNGLRKIKGVTISSPLHPALASAIVNYGVAGLTGLELQDELWNRKKYRVRAGGQMSGTPCICITARKKSKAPWKW